jgi:hypothetical protein
VTSVNAIMCDPVTAEKKCEILELYLGSSVDVKTKLWTDRDNFTFTLHFTYLDDRKWSPGF